MEALMQMLWAMRMQLGCSMSQVVECESHREALAAW
jgi:hypothetical protein